MSRNAGNIPGIVRVVSLVYTSSKVEFLIDSCREDIKIAVKKQKTILRSLLSTRIPAIRFERHRFDINDSGANRYRIIVFESEDDLIHMSKELSVIQQRESHTIAALFCEGKSINEVVWESCTCADAMVRFSSSDLLLRIVLDVCADIQLSHYHGLVGTDVNQNKLISRNKIDFIDSKSPRNVVNVRPGYIALSSCCDPDKGPFNESYYESVVAIWREFTDYQNHNLYQNRGVLDEDQIVNKIIEGRPDKGQISRRKLAKLVRWLPPGEYIFVRLARKPHGKKNAKAIKSQFGLKKLRIGKIKVLPYTMHYDYERYSEYVRISRFTIHEYSDSIASNIDSDKA